MTLFLIAVRRCLRFNSLLLAFGGTILFAQLSVAQQTESARKLVERTAAPYPPLARSMALRGIVRMDVLVLADGTVKDVAVKGGHPVLGQSAANTVRRWKWEPAAHESHEIVEVKFSPE